MNFKWNGPERKQDVDCMFIADTIHESDRNERRRMRKRECREANTERCNTCSHNDALSRSFYTLHPDMEEVK